jgi:hypothetical protein
MMAWQRPAPADTFSEFTYGFALVNELVSAGNPPILSVPVFPSLIKEGRAGGGYDVYLDQPGRPLFLQFKLSRHMRGWNAREFRQGLFKKPFYRMSVRPKQSSRQHQLLLALEQQKQGTVFYCAPAFHTLGELDALYKAGQIGRYSRFVRPSALPTIMDDDEHWLAFQRARGGTSAFFSDEGRRIELDERPIQERLQEALSEAHRVPFKETLNTLSHWFDEQVPRQALLWQETIAQDLGRREELPALWDHARELTSLEKVTMLAHTVLNSTFCVLQRRPEQRER